MKWVASKLSGFSARHSVRDFRVSQKPGCQLTERMKAVFGGAVASAAKAPAAVIDSRKRTQAAIAAGKGMRIMGATPLIGTL